ncbi:hypothetical protein B0T10DRAFT_400622 [Thelonectria olida]|uniref:tryptophan--tRNA ligase n=1 Tax=Thelonectria olida TaxID=1576542 RepID=A0A9P9AS29_9HYPO|nr:hypothetical protein B0T10DRAFT_400622 [Thelonectria olida]
MQKVARKAKVIFSGIQPTGVPHLGNYIGALRQWVQLQQSEEPETKLIYSIVDLHAITMPQPPDQLRKRKREAMAALLAIGIDPERATLFYQSSVPAHSELMWILSCTASSKLDVKESSSFEDRTVGSRLKLGLFSYPVLQAADILVHRATHVPVGHDQQQHIEFARECATNFNYAYGSHLVYPDVIIPPVRRIMSLTEPTSKMSKSHKSEKSRILITDSPQDIKKKLGSALTDSLPGVSYDVANRPGISNLLDILSIFDARGRTPEQLANEYSDIGPKQLKGMVTDAVVSGLHGIRDRYLELLDAGDAHLDKIESVGAQKARESAGDTMQMVKSAVGF